jgi:hypothetical protein
MLELVYEMINEGARVVIKVLDYYEKLSTVRPSHEDLRVFLIGMQDIIKKFDLRRT